MSDGSMKPISSTNLFDVVLRDEKQLQKLDDMIEQEVSTGDLCRLLSNDLKQTLTLLAKVDKGAFDYECK